MSLPRKRVVVGGLLHEGNTFSPCATTLAEFEVLHGAASIEKLAAAPVLSRAGVEVVPSLYANALPSGKVTEETYFVLSEKMLSAVERALPVAGVCLYLHGAMEVENVGSGEAALVKRIRAMVGPDVPIAVALDFHANNTPEFVASCNIICGYRTAPHTDQAETQVRAARLLLRCLGEGLLPKPVMVHIPVVTPGQALVTTVEPGRSLMRQTEAAEAKEGILFASLFGGNPWVDAPNMGPSVVVAAREGQASALVEARRLALLFWNARKEFHFEVESAEPEAAVEMALGDREGPVFVSDSGDNTTGGAPGDDARLLGLLLERQAANVLLAGITDAQAVEQCAMLKPGETLHCRLGGTLSRMSESLEFSGVLKRQGRILGWDGEDAGRCALVAAQGVDVLITEKRCGIVSRAILASAGIPDARRYAVVAIKLGYLWDDLRPVARRSILALTPGATCEAMEKIPYRNVRRPMYPLDKRFEWHPESDQSESP